MIEAPAPTPVKADLKSIQYLRALAAVGVLCFHAAWRAGLGFGVGAAGVDVFFVISGFIMWTVSARRPVRPAAFLLHRIERIVPLYWLVTLAMVGIAVAAPRLFPDLKPTAARLALSLAFVPHKDVAGLVAPILTAGWTLNYEMFFYLIFAGALLTPIGVRASLLTVALGVLTLIGWIVRPHGAVAATYTNSLLLEFAAGVWVAKAWRANRVLTSRGALGALAIGAAALAASAMAGVDIDKARIVFWGMPALLIVVGATSLDARGRMPSWPFLKLVGDASYSLYLVHGLAISACARVLSALGVTTGWPLAALCAIGGLSAGLVTYYGVERPLSARLRRRPRAAVIAATPSPAPSA